MGYDLPADLPELNLDARLGIELEGWFPRITKLTANFASQRRQALFCLSDAGVQIKKGTEPDYTRWNVFEERIRDYQYDANKGRVPEIVSPIITDIAGLADVRRVFLKLKAKNFTANRFAGLHVHVSRKDRLLSAREKASVEACLTSQFKDYQSWIIPERRTEWPANEPHKAFYQNTTHGTGEWRGREAETYADPSTMHYIIGVANFTLAAAEDPNARLTDYLPPHLSHEAKRPTGIIHSHAGAGQHPV